MEQEIARTMFKLYSNAIPSTVCITVGEPRTNPLYPKPEPPPSQVGEKEDYAEFIVRSVVEWRTIQT